MKSTGKLIMFAFTFLALTASAYTQSPREQLLQWHPVSAVKPSV